MTIANADVAAVFSRIADLLEVQGANPFRIRAYRNAARNVGELGRSVAWMVEAGEDLDRLPGIGADLACRIARDEGVLVSIASDAHGVLEFGHLEHGVATARRGWLRAADVLNTRSLDDLRPLLAGTMGRATPSRAGAPPRRAAVHAA